VAQRQVSRADVEPWPWGGMGSRVELVRQSFTSRGLEWHSINRTRSASLDGPARALSMLVGVIIWEFRPGPWTRVDLIRAKAGVNLGCHRWGMRGGVLSVGGRGGRL